MFMSLPPGKFRLRQIMCRKQQENKVYPSPGDPFELSQGVIRSAFEFYQSLETTCQFQSSPPESSIPVIESHQNCHEPASYLTRKRSTSRWFLRYRDKPAKSLSKSLSTKDFGTLLSIMPHWPQGNSSYAGETSKGDDSKVC